MEISTRPPESKYKRNWLSIASWLTPPLCEDCEPDRDVGCSALSTVSLSERLTRRKDYHMRSKSWIQVIHSTMSSSVTNAQSLCNSTGAHATERLASQQNESRSQSIRLKFMFGRESADMVRPTYASLMASWMPNCILEMMLLPPIS